MAVRTFRIIMVGYGYSSNLSIQHQKRNRNISQKLTDENYSKTFWPWSQLLAIDGRKYFWMIQMRFWVNSASFWHLIDISIFLEENKCLKWVLRKIRIYIRIDYRKIKQISEVFYESLEHIEYMKGIILASHSKKKELISNTIFHFNPSTTTWTTFLPYKEMGGVWDGYLFNAFNISMVTSTERAIVMGWGSLNILQSRSGKFLGSAGHCIWCVCQNGQVQDKFLHSS